MRVYQLKKLNKHTYTSTQTHPHIIVKVSYITTYAHVWWFRFLNGLRLITTSDLGLTGDFVRNKCLCHFIVIRVWKAFLETLRYYVTPWKSFAILMICSRFGVVIVKCMFLYSAVSSRLKLSKLFTLQSPDRHVLSQINSRSLGSINPLCH